LTYHYGLTFFGGLNQFKVIANLTPSQRLLEKNKKTKCIDFPYPGNLEYEQKNKKVKPSKPKNEGEKL